MKERSATGWPVGIFMIVLLFFAAGGPARAGKLPIGDRPLGPIFYQRHLKVFPDKAVEALPASYDARTDGIVTPPKDQGTCGSCRAFACVGAMESRLLKKFSFGQLSEEQQVSCNASMGGCCGGDATAMQYWETHGPIYEACFPCGDYGTSCPTYSTVACSGSAACPQLSQRVTGWRTVAESQFKASLYDEGPSCRRFDVYSDFFSYWSSGDAGAVFTQRTGTFQAGRAVLIIGWDDNKGAYLCKNSWGANGGPNGDGTFWIAYSGHLHNLWFRMCNFDLSGGCGDGFCGSGENPCTCPADCGAPPSSGQPGSTCADRIDNDCDGLVDCDGGADCSDPDGDCRSDPVCQRLERGAACSQNSQCCSKRCFKGTCN